MSFFDSTLRSSHYRGLPDGLSTTTDARVDKSTRASQHCGKASVQGLINCKDCSRTFTKRMHYKFETLYRPFHRLTGLTFIALAVIAKPTIVLTIVVSVPKPLHYNMTLIVIKQYTRVIARGFVAHGPTVNSQELCAKTIYSST